MRITLTELRLLVREEFETAYNDYRAAQDNIMRRVRVVGPEDVRHKHPKFFSSVADGLHAADRSDEVPKTKWYFLRTTYNHEVPYAMFPTGDNRLVFWDNNTDTVLPCESDEIYHALAQFGDKTQSS